MRLATSTINPGFEFTCTALWRGYVGSWEIVDGRLYLIGISGTLKGGEEAALITMFPDFPDRVFAHWYSGTIRIPQGKELEYIHMGYGSTFERDLLLDLFKGEQTVSLGVMDITSYQTLQYFLPLI